MSTPEGVVVKDCLELLRVLGFITIRNNSGRKGGVNFGLKDSSDIIACAPHGGRFVAVECKDQKGQLTEGQRFFLDDVRRCGGLPVVARSAEDLRDTLHREGMLK